MELLYFWINDDLTCLENIGFNFGGKYFYDYDKGKNYLNIRKNKDYCPGLFNIDTDIQVKGQIVNLSAVVGQNGSGKTSVINILNEYFISSKTTNSGCPQNSLMTHKAVFVLRKNDKFIINSIPYTNDTRSPNDRKILFPEKFQDHEYLNPPEQHFTKDYIENFSLIYFTPVLDGAPLIDDHQEYDNHHNISTKYLMFAKDQNTLTNEDDQEIKLRNIPPLAYHMNNENRKILMFLTTPNSEQLLKDLDLPKIDVLQLGPWIDFSEDEMIKKLQERLKTFNIEFESKAIKNALNNQHKRRSFIVHIFLCYIYSYARMLNLPEELKKSSVTITLQDSLSSAYRKIGKSMNLIPEFRYLSKSLLSFTKNICKDYNRLEVESEYSFPKIVIRKKQDKGASFNDFLKQLGDLLKEQHLHSLFNIQLITMSSGELALLKQYSRFLNITQSLPGNTLKDNILILIDEGELYLHPQWQKEYIFRITEMCKLFFPAKNTQIIFATNNPLLLSDIPTHNIVFLKKNKEEKILTVDIDIQQTFAANIHTLFKDSFFLKDGLIGKFAQEKIKHLIAKIKNIKEDISEKKMTSIDKDIAVIGEPFLRKKIYELYISKLPEHNKKKAIQDQLEQLERERENLQKKLNEVDDDKNK